MKRILAVFILVLAISTSAYAASEKEDAARYLSQNGMYQGDQNGNLNLDSGLTRAELAVILTRIRGDEDTVKASIDEYTMLCYFVDVPQWAKPYVGYCADNLLMNGYDLFKFGANDPVNPQAACTVILRHMGYPETDWNYSTACTKAVNIGLAPEQGLSGANITRGDFAVIIYRAMTGISHPQENEEISEKVLDGGDWSREDFSQQANPAIFDSVYTRAAYNAIRQSIVDRDVIIAGNNSDGFNPAYEYAYTTASTETKEKMNHVISSMSMAYQYSLSAEPYLKNYYLYPNYFIITANHYTYYEETNNATDVFIKSIEGLSDREKVIQINNFVCDRFEYDENAGTGPRDAFTGDAPVKGACTNYAMSFQYLCDRANIPALRIGGEDHTWNMVYVDEQWLHVDTQLNDLNTTRDTLLLSENSRKNDRDPQRTTFTQELLVPGSTK